MITDTIVPPKICPGNLASRFPGDRVLAITSAGLSGYSFGLVAQP